MKTNSISKALVLLALFVCTIGLQKAGAQDVALRTSATGWLTATPNIEVSVPVSQKVSLHLPVAYNPWVFGENSRFQHLSVMPGARYWFHECYSHFFLSTYGVATRFHMGGFFNKDYRYDGNAFGIGIGGGYAYVLNKHFNIEAELGIGAVYADYDKCWWPEDSRLIASEKGLRFIPTKIDISIVYLF